MRLITATFVLIMLWQRCRHHALKKSSASLARDTNDYNTLSALVFLVAANPPRKSHDEKQGCGNAVSGVDAWAKPLIFC